MPALVLPTLCLRSVLGTPHPSHGSPPPPTVPKHVFTLLPVAIALPGSKTVLWAAVSVELMMKGAMHDTVCKIDVVAVAVCNLES